MIIFGTRTIWKEFWQKAKRNFCLFPFICLFWCLWKARNETGVLCQQKCWRVPLCVGHFNPPWMIVEKVLLGDSQKTHPTVVPSPLKCLFCKKRKLQFFVCSWKLFFCERGKISEKSVTCCQEPRLENNYNFVFVFSVLFQQDCQRCWLGHAGCSYDS